MLRLMVVGADVFNAGQMEAQDCVVCQSADIHKSSLPLGVVVPETSKDLIQVFSPKSLQ